MSPPEGAVTHFALPTEKAAPVGITADDQAVWFVEIGAGQVGRVTPDGEVTEFPLPTAGSEPHGLAVPDDEVWVALETGKVATLRP
ncbi:virginiamycin B lyase family protein [Amycolatopsis methanolica]|uniref:virginiamycin B lyase family protein n=1 Tax=Amycolatopsis methanolica TaxID=1814 RepID=UPI0003691DDC|nr:hypothetical protein [Amycolatopsis methanolica]